MIDTSIIRILLTYLRTAKYVGQSTLQKKLDIITQELDVSAVSLNEVINEINNGIIPTGFKIDRCMNEVTNEITYSLVNGRTNLTVDKELSMFKIGEIDVIQKSIDEIFLNNFHVEYNDLIDKLITHYKINKTSVELASILDKMISLGYLERINGYLLPSIRLLLELKPFLHNKYPLITCHNCDNVVTRGVTKDLMSFHYKCFEIYKRNNAIEDHDLSYIGLKI